MIAATRSFDLDACRDLDQAVAIVMAPIETEAFERALASVQQPGWTADEAAAVLLWISEQLWEGPDCVRAQVRRALAELFPAAPATVH